MNPQRALRWINRLIVMITLLFSLALGSIGLLWYSARQGQAKLWQLAQEVHCDDLSDQENVFLQRLQRLHEKNEDLFGWLKIEGTTIDFPVMATPRDPEFYLRRDFDKRWSHSGLPFLSDNCLDSLNCDNWIIYGHHMKTHSMFTDLLLYEDEQFAREHPIQFSTLEETGVYRVIAALQADNNSALPFYKTTDFSDLGQFERWIQTVESASLYDMNIEANAGDTYITLITCRESSSVNERFIVVARESGGK